MTSSVLSVRIPEEIKKELEELDINVSEVIRQALEERIKKEKAKKVIKEIKEFRKNMEPIDEDVAVKFVREERDRNG